MILLGDQRRDSAIHTHVSILPQAPLPSGLPHNIEQSSVCYTVGPCWLSAAATAKSLQLCPTLCDPMDCSLPGSSVYGIFQARVLGWGAIAFFIKEDSEVVQSCLTLCDPMDCSLPGSSVYGIFQARVLEWDLLCRWKKLFAMTSAFSWQNSVSLCPASFCTPRPNLPVTLGNT